MVKILSKCFLVIAVVAFTVTGAIAQTTRPNPSASSCPTLPEDKSDYVGRTVGAKLQENLGRPVVVENRPGGNAVIGTELVAKARPDGYTLLVAGFSVLAANMAMYKNLPYDTLRDFAPITNVQDSQIVVAVNPKVPVNSIKELIAYAKANPGKLNYGSAGVGNTLHLAGEMFCLTTGTKMTHIPYKGASQALTDLLRGGISADLRPAADPFVQYPGRKAEGARRHGGETPCCFAGCADHGPGGGSGIQFCHLDRVGRPRQHPARDRGPIV